MPKRRRTPKVRRYGAVAMVVPGARRELAEGYAEPDPRYNPPRVDRTMLDVLDSGAPVVVEAWRLPDAAWRSFGEGIDAQDVLVVVEADDTVRVADGGVNGD
jgi:hypothetical protein